MLHHEIYKALHFPLEKSTQNTMDIVMWHLFLPLFNGVSYYLLKDA
jgi:hypothetical protein